MCLQSLIYGGKWRRRRDSNSRRTFILAGFQDQCIQPLCHPSGCGGILLYSLLQSTSEAESCSGRVKNRDWERQPEENLIITASSQLWPLGVAAEFVANVMAADSSSSDGSVLSLDWRGNPSLVYGCRLDRKPLILRRLRVSYFPYMVATRPWEGVEFARLGTIC